VAFWLILVLGLAVAVMSFRFGVAMLQARWIRDDGDPQGARLYRAAVLGWSVLGTGIVLQFWMGWHARHRAREAGRSSK
jgi:hypothetical protein